MANKRGDMDFITVREAVLNDVEVMKEDVRGSLHTFTIRGTKELAEAKFARVETVFFETLPLSLEEIFISETEVVGYDIKKLIFD